MRALHSLLKSVYVITAFVIALSAVNPANAHDIPGKVTVLMFVKVEADRVLVVARAPLETFAEVQIPVRGPGFLDMSKATLPLQDAAQMYVGNGLDLMANGESLGTPQVLNTRVALPSDKSFTNVADALKSVQSPPLPADTDLYWKQAYFDVLFAFPLPNKVDARTAKFSLNADLARLSMQTHTVLRYVPLQGDEHIFDYVGHPGTIELEPGRWFAFAQFVSLGFWHILDGVDHLLFLFCLIIPALSIRALIPLITAFTVAHSITLISSALGLVPTALWFGPLIETLIAFSVLFMACENIFAINAIARWPIVFAFGLIHGFGFSFILADRMQFAGAHLLSALLAFNVGVELGQLAVLIVAVPILGYFYRAVERLKHGKTTATILLSALAAHSAWHWVGERGEKLLQFRWERPQFDAVFFAAVTRWTMLLIAIVMLLWATRELIAKWSGSRNSERAIGDKSDKLAQS